MTGLYIHLPFCKQKCNYCDFASFAGRELLIDDYLRALAKEAAQSSVRRFDTLYVGGGTPSLLSEKQLCALVYALEKNFGPVSAYAESTFEANPESLTPEKLNLLRNAGFNRLSLGLQSFDDAELKTLGRVHDVQTFLKTYENARKSGFDNLNADLIAGLPGQPLKAFLANLEHLLNLIPEHVSVYGLQIEEGTPFFERGIVCDQPLMRRMLEETHFRLEDAGYHHYEISNFARPGKEARHNTNYWREGAYIGLGSAAASYWDGVRKQNTPDLQEYIRRINAGEATVVFSEKLAGREKAGERLMLALRRLDGTELTDAEERWFGSDIETHVRNGLLARENNKIKLTFEGLFLANEVFCSFVAPFED